MQNAERIRRIQFGAGVGDREFVGLVFAELLNLLATVLDVYLQGRRRARFGPERDAGLGGKLRDKSLDTSIEGRIAKARGRNGERPIDK